MKNRSIPFLLLIGIIFSSSQLNAQVERISLQGFVLDIQNNTPLAKVKVELKNIGKGTILDTKYTNSDGQYEFIFDNLSIVYVIEATIDGYNSNSSPNLNYRELYKNRKLEPIYLTKHKIEGTSTDIANDSNEVPDTIYIPEEDKTHNPPQDHSNNTSKSSNNTSKSNGNDAKTDSHGQSEDSQSGSSSNGDDSKWEDPPKPDSPTPTPEKPLWIYLIIGSSVLLLGIGIYFLRKFLIERDLSSKSSLEIGSDKPVITKETISEGDIKAVLKKGIDFESTSPDAVGNPPDSTSDSKIGYHQGSAKGLIANEDAPRFLQAAIKDTNENYAKDFLAPDQDYKVDVRIGYDDKDYYVTEEQFDSSAVFANSTMDFEPIQIKFKSNLDDKVHFTEIQLPRQGNSESAYFNIHTKTKEVNFQGEFYAYHRGRLMQQVQLILPVQKEKSASSPQRVKMKTIFCTRKNLSDITTRSDFSTSVEYKAGPEESSSLEGINKGQPVDLFFENGLKEHLADMKAAIENALIDINNHPANLLAKGNQELLLFLALKGNLIHTNFIRGAIAPEGPIQIITNYQDYVPLEFVYNLPPPMENATLCEHAIDALKSGTCKGCFNHNEDPAPHICPFGFWSFSRIVERHSYQKRKNDHKADYILVSEPSGKRTPLPVLQNAIYGSSQRVETSNTKGIREEIANGIKKNTQHFFEADDWKNWEKVTRENLPDSHVLVVHIEKDKKFNIDKIEIGNDFVMQNYFQSQVIVNKDIETPPFIIVIGCESTDLSSSGFDVSSHLMNAGAAIVISNFTKIRGRQAKDIVIKLFDFLKENGDKEIILGEIMLKLRQYLLAEGLIAGLSLVVQGDADWNIKS